MKKAIRNAAIILCLSLMSSTLLAQWDRWTDPQTLTNPLTDNRNAIVKLLDFEELDHFMFWEKSTDSLSTAIYYKQFYGESEAEVFMSDDGVHYLNPQLMDTKYHVGNDTLFGVFYLSDETGVNQIYYQVYNHADGFTVPQMLSSSEFDQSDLHCNDDGRIVWMEQFKIMVSILDKSTFIFSEPIVLDSGNCTFPTLINASNWWKRYDNPEVAWIKEENDSASVWIANYDNQNAWLEPEKHFTARQCTNLTFCEGFGSPFILSWDFRNEGSWHFVHYALDAEDMQISEIEQEEPFQPVYYSGFLFVKERDFDVGFCSLKYMQNDSVNVFTTRDFFWWNGDIDQYQNVSNSSNEVNCPQLFSGKYESPCKHYFINIWEEKINDRWQLRYSETYECLSGIDEKDEANSLIINTTPNPFQEEIAVTFILDQPAEVVLSVFNSNGNLVETLESNNLTSGEHHYKWNGKMHKAGLYFVSLQRNLETVTQKIILTK